MIASGVIPAECASKSNSRRFTKTGRLIKSKKALDFVEVAGVSVLKQEPLYDGPVSVTAYCYYASRRPDLDPQLLLDCLQGKVYVNDRQVVELKAVKCIDRKNPRVEWIADYAEWEWSKTPAPQQ